MHQLEGEYWKYIYSLSTYLEASNVTFYVLSSSAENMPWHSVFSVFSFSVRMRAVCIVRTPLVTEYFGYKFSRVVSIVTNPKSPQFALSSIPSTISLQKLAFRCYLPLLLCWVLRRIKLQPPTWYQSGTHIQPYCNGEYFPHHQHAPVGRIY